MGINSGNRLRRVASWAWAVELLSTPAIAADAADAFRQGKWPFLPPVRPAVPAVKNTAWVVNPIDRFTLSQLEAVELAPNVPADKLTLLRRVTFDLTGLAPTPAEQQAFLA